MALEGKLVKSRRKAQFNNEKNTSFAPKRLEFAHQMNAGETDINLTSLVLPSGMAGFTQASGPDLVSANLYSYKSNLSLKRSDGGELIPYLEFIVVSNTLIRLLTPAQQGTIVYGTINSSPSSGTIAIDGFQIVATGTLTVGQTDITTGMPFKLFENPTQQIGSVLVFRNGRLMTRNDTNLAGGTGNYFELPSGLNLSNAIRFNRPGETLLDGSLESYMVISNGAVALQPTASMFAVLDSLGGQMDKVIQVLAAVSGNPESFFQANPNQVDLRVFGDRLIQAEADIEALENPTEQHCRFTGGATSFGSTNGAVWIWAAAPINVGTDITPVLDPALGSYFQINTTGLYSFLCQVRTNTASGTWVMKNVPAAPSTAPLETDPNLLGYEFSDAVTWGIPVSNTVFLRAGDKVFSGNDSGGVNNGTRFFEITRVR